ncbi:YphA family membrane protein [Caldifermentibacillus hisashii]|uniref:YphA family membrane protein n=1 Tax=Caldifermentibacillus hisashii TaxID=996558 RepID=UPI0031018B45
MAGFVFFGFAWAGWIYSTFIMEKTNPYRFPIAAYLLVTIILSVFKIRFLGLDISLATLFLLFISFLTFIKLPFWKLLYCTIGVFIVSSATAVFYLMSLDDLVWIFIDQQILLSFLGTCLAVLLFKEYKARIFSSIIGLIQGDILYAIILKKFPIDFPIGGFALLDGLALTCVFITTWSGFEYLQATFEHKNFQQKKEKQL